MAVVSDILDAAAQGTLIIALRSETGGEPFSTTDSDIWNSDDLGDAFIDCRFEKVHVNLFMAESRKVRSWIFVELGSLQRLINARWTDRSPKLSHDSEKMHLYAETELYHEVEAGQRERLTRDDFVKFIQAKFKDASSEQVRNEVWPKRPPNWPRRAAKNA